MQEDTKNTALYIAATIVGVCVLIGLASIGMRLKTTPAEVHATITDRLAVTPSDVKEELAEIREQLNRIEECLQPE